MSYRAKIAAFAGFASSALALLGASAATASRAVVQRRSAAATPASQVGTVPASSPINFSMTLQMRNRAGAIALEEAVSNPESAEYGDYLTSAQWGRRFSPAPSAVETVTAWLRSQGITVVGVTPDRMAIHAAAPADRIEAAFGVKLGEYSAHGHVVRLASGPLTVPASIAGVLSGVVGINQRLLTHTSLTGAETTAGYSARTQPVPKEGETPPPPPGFRNAPPCSGYFGEKKASNLAGYGIGYGWPLPWAVCGYVPAQLQGAYDLTGPIAAGINGTGVTVAIVDAYASPELRGDLETYVRNNQSNQPLVAGQFKEELPAQFNEYDECAPSSWYGEQSLDVEAVHAMAPGADILYKGAENCSIGLFEAVREVVDAHSASIISDSWSGTGGDLFEEFPGERSEHEAFDEVLIHAADEGIGVQFSAGDEGSNFTNLGLNVPDWPSDDPYATSVGGSSLEVSKANERSAEYGWSTSKSIFCSALIESLEPSCPAYRRAWLPEAPGAFDYGGGGGTSYFYEEPSYQLGVVPAALAARNATVELPGIEGTPKRVEPDISMDADPSTGMKIGETQTFEGGKVEYGEYRIGGTSLSSPLLAGLLADVDQAAGKAVGFANPLLYELAAENAPSLPGYGAFDDITAAHKLAMARNDYLNSENASAGILTSVRGIGYEGLEAYCSGTGECMEQDVELKAFPGFDSMTGIGTPGPNFLSALARVASR